MNSAATVYPRVCGATSMQAILTLQQYGLSPRVRGNRADGLDAVIGRRSIPACAGQPNMTRVVKPGLKVYPRVCGATTARTLKVYAVPGLSPRVRGNRDQHDRHGQLRRSIPACAGQPRLQGLWAPAPWVYPRVCGATLKSFSVVCSVRGLSPRVRGNLIGVVGYVDIAGSIPACAGQPRTIASTWSLLRVYPRVCGAT